LHFRRYARHWVYVSAEQSSIQIDDLSVLLR
jgi:hypothetical protein